VTNAFIWNGSPDLASIGPLTIRWYGLLFALGFFLGFKMITWMLKRERYEVTSLDSLLIYAVVGTIVGARLGHTLIYEPEIYLHDPIRILKVWEGGLASHGGSVGVMLGVWLWKRKHFPGTFLQLVDLLCVPTAFIAAMIRIGNFFNSEIVGRPTDLPWAIIFKRIDNLPRHPSMLYESLAYLVTFGVVFTMFKKGLQRRQGLLLGVFFILVFGARFGIEFVKEYQVPSEAALPMDLGQLLSIPFVLVGILLVILAFRRKQTQTQPKLKLKLKLNK
jgi:phosphatidylglycerol---prolipoprotein diacylglyceryl transferase